jgi:hypothetical protein
MWWLAEYGARLAHVLVGAGWLGATWFSLVVLHRRGPECFERDADFEQFITMLSDGNRRRIVGALVASVVTGGLLAWLVARGADRAWWALVAAKVVFAAGSGAIIYVVSWRLWPARVFALAHELQALRAAQTRLRICAVALLGASCALGILAQAMRVG